jgi:hypothetical protein
MLLFIDSGAAAAVGQRRWGGEKEEGGNLYTIYLRTKYAEPEEGGLVAGVVINSLEMAMA